MDIPLQRLNRMSDLVFASAMTILIFLLKLPTEAQIDSKATFELYLDESLPSLYLFLITFLVVAIYWVKDVGQFKHITTTNGTHTWLQLGSLVFLILLPWTNSLLEIKPDNLNVRIIYCLDIFLIGLFSSIAWYYASKNHRLVNADIDKKQIFEILEVNLTEPAVALIAIIVVLFFPGFFSITFILIPLLYILQKKIRSKLKGNVAKPKTSGITTEN
jgi:uncharacterized membrane protein